MRLPLPFREYCSGHPSVCWAVFLFIAAVPILTWSVSEAEDALGPGDTIEPASAAAGSAGLEEIVVTAQRRSENLQHAAISVTAISSDRLESESVTTAANLTELVLSLQASNQASYTVFYIRGIGSDVYNPYSEPAVAFNFDGVYIARPTAVNGQFFDVERVEVLNGPQGTLYGRNATGGAINLIPKSPDLGRFGGD